MRIAISMCLAIGLSLTLGHTAPTFGQDQPGQPGQDQVPSGGPLVQPRRPTQRSQQLYDVLVNQDQPLHYWLSNDTLTPGSFAFFDAANRNSGLSLAAVDDALRAHLKLPKDEGLIVTSLDAHSPAALAGIQQNDVLLDLHGATLRTPEDLDEALRAAGAKPASLVLLR